MNLCKQQEYEEKAPSNKAEIELSDAVSYYENIDSPSART